MPIQIDCPTCARALRLPEELMGQEVRCPNCEKIFKAEQTTSGPPLAPSPSLEPDAGRFQSDEPPGSDVPRPSPRREYDDDEDHRRRPPYFDRDYAPGRGGLVFGLGLASLLTGTVGACILSFLVGPVALGLGIPAWLLGQRDLQAIREGRMDPMAEGMTKAGWIMGIIGTILGGLIMLGCLAYVGFILAMAASGNM